MELIIEKNKLVLSSRTPVVNDTVTTRPKEIAGKDYTFELTRDEKVIRVNRKRKGEETQIFDIPVEHTRLYTHVLAPRVVNYGQQDGETVYPKISHTDPFMLLYLAAPGDLVSIIRIVAYKGAGTEKTESFYHVV